MNGSAAIRQQALARASAGDDGGAAALFDRGVAAYPADAALANSAGSFHAGRGRNTRALEFFELALTIDPAFGEAAINRAIALSALGRPADALAALEARRAALGGSARYWSVRGAIERSLGQLAAAAQSYDACLAREPGYARGTRARARIALERGEVGTVARIERALAMNQGDPELWLELAQACDAEGKAEAARDISETLVKQLPHWTAALELLAQLRWAAGEGATFCDHYAAAFAASGSQPAVGRSWIALLAGVDRHEEAAHVARQLRQSHPDDPTLALAEASQASAAGEDARAATIFAALTLPTPERWLAEARHRLRLGEPTEAEALTARVIKHDPGNVAAWALRDVAWRLICDTRHHWLHGQAGLIDTKAFVLEAGVVALLRSLHARSAAPIGQSVRGGTQTRGGLFDRTEPELRDLADALIAAFADYRRKLPPADDGHPLLRHRNAPWRISGSWSVRLTGAGRHVAHIHSGGMVSSAAYLVVPTGDAEAPDAGALELGRPPADLRVDLPALATIRPQPGLLALFPSTLFHGTRRFAGAERMTVAFDIVAA